MEMVQCRFCSKRIVHHYADICSHRYVRSVDEVTMVSSFYQVLWVALAGIHMIPGCCVRWRSYLHIANYQRAPREDSASSQYSA